MAIYLKITNASDVVAKNTSKWFENITPDRIDRKLVEDQVIKGLIEQLQIEGIQGEISAINGIELKDNTLTIEGNKESGDPNAKEVADNYIYKGIANRKFKRAFTLAETVEVKDVRLAHGVLTVDLENIIPEEQKPKKFKINSSGIVDKFTNPLHKVKKSLLTE